MMSNKKSSSKSLVKTAPAKEATPALPPKLNSKSRTTPATKKDQPSNRPMSKTKSQQEMMPSRMTTFMRSSSESAKRSVQSASGYLQRSQSKDNRNTVPMMQKAIKVAPESLAERAKATSEERINRFRKNLSRTNSEDKPTRPSNRKSSTASESDRESIRSFRVSRSSSISSESSVKSFKARSLPPGNKKAAETSKTKTVPKQQNQKPKPSTKSANQPPTPETKSKKLFPRNPIQNLIKFYESSEKQPERRDENSNDIIAGAPEKVPVVLEDKYNKVLFRYGKKLANWN